MDSPSEEQSRRQSRHGPSGRGNLPRRPTRGPLDIAASPLATDETPTSKSPPPSIARQGSSLLSPTSSQYLTPQGHRTPRLPSPTPGSNLSNISSVSYRTAKTSSSATHSPTRSSTLASPLKKDFGFLLRPEIYHPLTHLDIPPPFRTLSNQPTAATPLDVLVSHGHFRSAAIKAAQILTSPTLSPFDHEQIFSLVHTRLSSLTLCNQTAFAAQEVKALEDLNSSYYRDESTDRHLVLWELRVLAVRLQGMGFNDARRGVMGYYDLAREARLTLTALKKSKSVTLEDALANVSVESEINLWEDRLSELGIRVASALVEMEDLEGAARFLATLDPPKATIKKPDDDTDTNEVSSSSRSKIQMHKALLWLCLGDVEAARSCITTNSSASSPISEDDKNLILALSYMADAEYEPAVAIWEVLISSSSEIGERAMYQQNLAVCLLYLGRMSEARKTLEQLINQSPQNSFHALTFNLSTIYELCTERSRALKIGLAEKVAEMLEDVVDLSHDKTDETKEEGEDDGGEGTDGEKREKRVEGKATGGFVGWEKINSDFKL